MFEGDYASSYRQWLVVSLRYWDCRTERITLQGGMGDADVYHRWGRSGPVLQSGCFRHLQTFGKLPWLTSLYDIPVCSCRDTIGATVDDFIILRTLVKVILRPTVSRPFYPGVRHPSGTRDQFLPLLSLIIFRQLRVC
jgi:hypothetical protein